jgi:hypothetical protein
MALFLIERNFADQLQISVDAARLITNINSNVGVHWLLSFLSADKKKTYCLYEAPNVESVREASRLAQFPADLVVEVTQIRPDALISSD